MTLTINRLEEDGEGFRILSDGLYYELGCNLQLEDDKELEELLELILLNMSFERVAGILLKVGQKKDKLTEELQQQEG